MVEVFKTNVIELEQASMLVNQIHKSFTNYKANFDLEDCDKILRVKSTSGQVQSSLLIHLLQKFGFEAEVLPDEIVSFEEQLQAVRAVSKRALPV